MKLNKECQVNSENLLTEDQRQWNDAIAGIEKELFELEKQSDADIKRAKDLKSVIATFKGNRDRGYKWPGSDASIDAPIQVSL